MKADASAPPLLDEAFFGGEENEVAVDGSNALLVMPRKAKKPKAPPRQQQKQQQQKQQQQQPKHTSTRKQRKLQQLLRKHKDKEEKSKLSKELQQHQLAPLTDEDGRGAAAAPPSTGESAGAADASAAADGPEEVRLAKAQLLLSGGAMPVLTGVKGRRLQKKARKLMQLQQVLLERQQQMQQQKQQHKQQKEQQQQQQQRDHEQQQQAALPVGDSTACKRKQGEAEGQQKQQQQEQRRQQQKQQQQQQEQQNGKVENAAAANGEAKNRKKESGTDVAATATSSSSNSSSLKGASSTSKPCAIKRVAATPGSRRGLPMISYSPERAELHLRRSPDLETLRWALPAAEAEGRVLSFLVQQEHPSAQEAGEEGSSSSGEEASKVDRESSKTSRKRKKQVALTKCRHADVLCVSGATGSGKSTQIPQFVFESGICYPSMIFPAACAAACRLLSPTGATGERSTLGEAGDAPGTAEFVSAEKVEKGIRIRREMRICVTQPRRVAAVALARRVAEEMGAPELVGYQIRYDKQNVGPNCRLKFATDGILLREIQEDFLCSKYCCIIVDEAHERTVNVDLLLGLLSRVVTFRRQRFLQGDDTLPPLKVLVMSATLKAADFTENSRLFSPSPALLSLESRTFDVRVHFSKKTSTLYVDAAVKKALQIHTRLPAGSVLVFLTGRAEVLEAVHQLQNWQRRRDKRQTAAESAAAAAALEAAEMAADGSASDVSFELSDQSEGEPLPLDEEQEHTDSDSELSVHSEESHSQRTRRSRDTLSRQLQLSLASDTEEEEQEEGVNEAEAKVLKAVAARRRPTQLAVKDAKRASPAALPTVSDTHGGKRGLPTKRRKTDACINGTAKQVATTASSGGLTEAASFDAPDTMKRRLRKTVSGGGWLGAGAHLRQATTQAKGEDANAQEIQEQAGAPKELARAVQGDAYLLPRLTAIPLYATLPAELQKIAFEPPAPDERRIIVATNVAETSLTLPNVRYVVDPGREKRRVFSTGSDCFSYFTVTLTSQAAAQQRAGRAGRVGAGVCYRLYSSAVYTHEMEPHPPPQIHSVPLDHLLLFMATLGIPRPSAFPFPSPPPAAALAGARERLVALGALEPKRNVKANSTKQQMARRKPEVCCTILGRRMSELPIPPRFAKMLLLASSRHKEHGTPFVALACYFVAALCVGELLPRPQRDGLVGDIPPTAASSGGERHLKRPWEEYDSDIEAYVWLCGAYSHACNPVGFCHSYGLDPSRLAEVGALAAQLAQLLRPLLQRARQRQQVQADPRAGEETNELEALKPPLRLELPSAEAKRCLHQCFIEGHIDHVAVWQEPARLPPDATPAQRAAARGGYRCAELKGQLAILHPTSNLLHVIPRPKLLVYNQLLHEGRGQLQVCAPLDGADLSASDTSLVQHTVLHVPPPAYDEGRDAVVGWSRPTYLPLQLPLPAVERPLPRIRASADSLLSTQQQQQQQQIYGCFAAAIVAGRAVPRLKRFAASLAVSPEGMLAGNRAGTFAVRAFVAELAKSDVASRAELVKVWKSDPKYLLAEFIGLLRSYNYDTLQDIRDMWPPL